MEIIMVVLFNNNKLKINNKLNNKYKILNNYNKCHNPNNRKRAAIIYRWMMINKNKNVKIVA